METNPGKMEAIIALCKRRGFVYQGSEIYGGLAGTWDYGPLGVMLKKNIENLWWKMFVDDREDMYGIDAAILMNPAAWVASGHVGGFSDPLVECEHCKERFRVDQLPGFSQTDYQVVQREIALQFKGPLESVVEEINTLLASTETKLQKVQTIKSFIESEPLSDAQKQVFYEVGSKLMNEIEVLLTEGKGKLFVIEATKKILEQSNRYIGYVTQQYLNRFISCPLCSSRGKWDTPRQFNMMFQTQIGAKEDASNVTYLRPETAGGMFVNYKNVIDSLHPKLPFGLAQIGKAFRNEIAPRDFIFRVRELEQMEIEYFVRPEEWEEHFEHWRKEMWRYIEAVGLNANNVHELEVAAADRAHYSKRTIDFEYDFPFGRKELYGLAYRADFDLRSHQEGSKVNLEYFDEEKKDKFLPHVIEPTFGVGRTLLAILSEAYTEDEMGGEKRVYLKFKPEIAPIRVAVFPLLKNKPELVAKAREVFTMLKKDMRAMFDDNGNIGKRYRRQDEIGTPYCVTIDFDTLGEEKPELKDTVTLRNRDTGEQERVAISDLLSKIA